MFACWIQHHGPNNNYQAHDAGMQDHGPWSPESWTLGSRIPLKIETQNPSSTDKESGIHCQYSGIQNVESRGGEWGGGGGRKWIQTNQHAKKVVSDSPGPVDFPIGRVNCELTGKWSFLRNSNYRRNVISILLIKTFFGLVCTSLSLPAWQTVKMTFFAPRSFRRNDFQDRLGGQALLVSGWFLPWVPKRFDKWLRGKLVSFSLIVSGVGNCVPAQPPGFRLRLFRPDQRKRLHKKRVQLPQDWFGTPSWPPFHCFGTPIWPPWRHVKTLYTRWLFNMWLSTLEISAAQLRSVTEIAPKSPFTLPLKQGLGNNSKIVYCGFIFCLLLFQQSHDKFQKVLCPEWQWGGLE